MVTVSLFYGEFQPVSIIKTLIVERAALFIRKIQIHATEESSFGIKTCL